MRIKRTAVFVLAIILSLFLKPVQALEAFVIDNYQVEIVVNSDNSYDIVEKIEANFSRERHGIFRSIPSRQGNGRALVRDIEVDGHQFQVDRGSNYTTIMIGDPEAYVDGKQIYTIRYNYLVGEDGISEYDEFYFNLIGTEWNTYINAASFKITMPREFNAERLNFTSGAVGSTDSSNVQFLSDGQVITGKILSRLDPKEGVTVALPLPEGYYTDVADLSQRSRLMKFAAYIISLLLVFLAFTRWKKYGRDRELFAPVQFYPPQQMTSAELGYIIDGVVDNKDITSLIILWAAKGYLKIVTGQSDGEGNMSKATTKEFMLVKLKNVDDKMRVYEQQMFDSLFDTYGDGTRVSAEDLKNKFFETVNTTQLKVRHYFSDEKSLYTATSRRLRILFHLLALIPSLLVLFASFYPELVFAGSPLTVIMFIVIGAILVDLPVLVLMELLAFRTKIKAGSKYRFATFLGAVIALVPSLVAAYFVARFTDLNLIDLGAMIVITGIINFLAFIMPKRTEYGNICAEQILGFKDFLQHAEKPRLEALVNDNPEYYYQTMAYALVLGVSDVWARKFDSIAMEPPTWYSGYPTGRYSPLVFQRHLSRSFNSVHSSMVSMPSAKPGGGFSSAGGGSVGGGSGGGGGGSW